MEIPQANDLYNKSHWEQQLRLAKTELGLSRSKKIHLDALKTELSGFEQDESSAGMKLYELEHGAGNEIVNEKLKSGLQKQFDSAHSEKERISRILEEANYNSLDSLIATLEKRTTKIEQILKIMTLMSELENMDKPVDKSTQDETVQTTEISLPESSDPEKAAYAQYCRWFLRVNLPKAKANVLLLFRLMMVKADDERQSRTVRSDYLNIYKDYTSGGWKDSLENPSSRLDGNIRTNLISEFLAKLDSYSNDEVIIFAHCFHQDKLVQNASRKDHMVKPYSGIGWIQKQDEDCRETFYYYWMPMYTGDLNDLQYDRAGRFLFEEKAMNWHIASCNLYKWDV